MFELTYNPLHGLTKQLSMNTIKNMHKVRFPNIYILIHIIYYVLSLTINIVLTIKGVGFSMVRQNLSNIFAMHYGNMKDLNMNLFIWISFYCRLKKILLNR